MSTSVRPSFRPSAPYHLHVVFMTLLPRIELHGRIYFRHLSPHQKADAVQEMRGLACYTVAIREPPIFLPALADLQRVFGLHGRRFSNGDSIC